MKRLFSFLLIAALMFAVAPDAHAAEDRYSVPGGYDYTDIKTRGSWGAPCNLSTAAELLSTDLSDASARIFAAVEADEQILSYGGAGRDIYADILTYATALFLARHYDHIIEAPAALQLGKSDMTALRQSYWEVVRLSPILRESDLPQPERALQVNVESVPLSELAEPLDEFESFRLEVYLSAPMRNYLQTALRGTGTMLPENGESDPARLAVAASACSLAGTVPYYMGGKSETVGWDERWGVPTVLTDGSVVPYGLDCSGFINWCFANSVGGAPALPLIGHGTQQQYLNCTVIDAAEARVGDLVFDISNGIAVHGGIIVGWNEQGELLVCHASSSHEKITMATLEECGCDVVCTPAAFYDAY